VFRLKFIAILHVYLKHIRSMRNKDVRDNDTEKSLKKNTFF